MRALPITRALKLLAPHPTHQRRAAAIGPAPFRFRFTPYSFTSRKAQELISRFAARRRQPIERDRYRAAARSARIRRPPRARWIDGALVAAIVLVILIALPRLAAGVRTGMEELGAQVQSAVPLLQGQSTLQVPTGGAVAPLGVAPVADNVPLFVRDPQLQLTGRVPSFAVQPGRTLQIVLNGTVVSSIPVADSGAFSASLALKDGANAISLTLMAGRDLVATSTYSVTLDRTAPTLTVARPQSGSAVDAQNVAVQGTTEAGATVTVNGHTVVVAQDGTFSDFITATPGPLAITIVSRDRAGNETTQKLDVTAQQTSQTPGTMLSVGLDRATVRPGQQVVASILLRDLAGPRVGVPVTLSVGVVFIGTATTGTDGTARIAFAAPPNEGEASVVVLAGSNISGRATLTVSR